MPPQTETFRGEFRTMHGRARLVAAAAEIDESTRKLSFLNHCKDFRYYEVVEGSLRQQFEHAYLILEREETGEQRIQPFFYVDQDLTAGLPKRFRLVSDYLRKRWPRLLYLRILMVGCSAGEGQIDSPKTWFVEALHEALEVLRKRKTASIILLKDFPDTYRSALEPFLTNGYRRVPSMPAAILELNFSTFEEYMTERLGKVFRKNLRRKFKVLADAAPLELEVTSDATSVAEELFPLYLQTFHRSDFKFEQLTKEYFTRLGQEMPDRVRYFIWRQNGHIIAFNLCMVYDGTLYDLAVGMDYAVALDLHLYFVTWRQVIEWCLINGIVRYHTGPLNYDPKLHLKLLLAPQDLYARHASPWLNPFFKTAIGFLQPARHDRTLKKFPNAHEM